MKIALLCNNKMAKPALEKMAALGVLCAVATADTDDEVTALYRELANTADVPFRTIGKKDLTDTLINWTTGTGADMVWVMTFPWRIPATVLGIPKMGFLNFHYGLLPEMRGADPIFESIRQQKKTAGATVHVMDENLDTGPILLREEIPLPPEYTYGMLCSQLAWTGEKMCVEMIGKLKHLLTSAEGISADNPASALNAREQNAADAHYWPKISEEELGIKWNTQSSDEIIAVIRSCNPVAKGVPATLNGWKIGICDVSLVNLQGDASAIKGGTIIAIDPQNGLLVCCRDGKAIRLEVVFTGEGVFPGYKLAFFGITNGMVFGN